MRRVAERPLRILAVSTPVSPLGGGADGGVALTVANLASDLQRRGHSLHVVAPAGSQLNGVPLLAVEGASQPTAVGESRHSPIHVQPDGVLERMWWRAADLQDAFDVLLNLAYDWLPFYLTPLLRTPVAHLVSMASLSDAMDRAICGTAMRFPGRVAVHTSAQAATFPCVSALRVVGGGIELARYHFSPAGDGTLAWVGRISPEKGLADALTAARMTRRPLRVMGYVQDATYWHQLREAFADVALEYLGFLGTDELQRTLGRCSALVMTPKWDEALGNVVMEALACGVPVVSYARGGPAELVHDGIAGLLVPPDDVQALAAAITTAERLDRAACRQAAEARFSLEAFGGRIEAWLREVAFGA